jgi:integrase
MGLQLRIRRKRQGHSRTWLLRYKWRGEPIRIVLGHRPTLGLADARAEALALRAEIDRGIDPRRARPRRRPAETPRSVSAAATGESRYSIEHMAREFMALHVIPERKQPAYVQRILDKDVLPVWKGRDARTIKAREVVELLDGIVARGSRVMANRVASVLTQMFKHGIQRTTVEDSPVKLLKRPGGKEKSRERALSEDELRAFLKDPKDATRFERLAHVITLLLLTGQRRGEIALARWSQVDLDAKTWTIPKENSKTGREHLVPLSDWAAEEFRALKRLAKRSPWVLPANGGDHHIDPKQLTRGVARCQARFKARGIAAFTLHDLRRTCRTGLARLKVEPHIAERVLNHAQERIPGTYDQHEYLEEKSEALEKWAAHLEGLKP